MSNLVYTNTNISIIVKYIFLLDSSNSTSWWDDDD